MAIHASWDSRMIDCFFLVISDGEVTPDMIGYATNRGT
jgi:hypothetical protein